MFERVSCSKPRLLLALVVRATLVEVTRVAEGVVLEVRGPTTRVPARPEPLDAHDGDRIRDMDVARLIKRAGANAGYLATTSSPFTQPGGNIIPPSSEPTVPHLAPSVSRGKFHRTPAK
jgi:hypothetical protein